MGKRKQKFRWATVLFMAVSFCIIVAFFMIEKNVKDRIVKNYLKSTEYESLITLYDNAVLRGNAQAFHWYEENFLGIDTNTALAGTSKNCKANERNYNKIGTIEAYQSKKKKLVVKIAGDKVFTSEDVVSEVIATPKEVFYIDETDGNTIHKYHIENALDEVFVSEPVEQFMLYGKYVFCLGKDGMLRQVAMDTKKSKDIASHIQRFFIADGFLVQNGLNIVSLDLDGNTHTELVANALLVGADKEQMYYINLETAKEGAGTEEIQGKFVLHAMTVSTKSVVPIEEREAFIRAVYVTSDGLLVDTIE